MKGRSVFTALFAAAVFLAGWGCGRRGGPVREFDIVFPGSSSPALQGAETLDSGEVRLLRVAARAASEVAGVPAGNPSVHVRLEPPPRGGGDGVLGEAHGDGITVVASADPLKTVFRAAHECAHALVAKRHGAGTLPLWLEEGLAQLAGFRAADAWARMGGLQALHVAPPEPWLELETIVSLGDYPREAHAIAAFYWQSAALVRALRARLGPEAFSAWLAAVADGADSESVLRRDYWFSDGDFEWLRRQIAPGAPAPASSSAGWGF